MAAYNLVRLPKLIGRQQDGWWRSIADFQLAVFCATRIRRQLQIAQ